MKPDRVPSRPRGSLTIEFALVFMSLWLVLLACGAAGYVTLQRNLIKDATHAGAMILANAASVELATPAQQGALEQRAEDLIQAAAANGSDSAPAIEIDPVTAINGYAPSVTVLRVTVEVPLKDLLSLGIANQVDATLEVPYGRRIEAP